MGKKQMLKWIQHDILLGSLLARGVGFMNKDWADLNKAMQLKLKKKETFSSGIEILVVMIK